jgi:hypothetical protein
MKTILYVHGMGGGGDSRIPNHLKTLLDPALVQVVIRTYDFDPPIGRAQLALWVEELKPDLVIGESLGAIQALRITGVPHLFVSPSLGAPALLVKYAPLARWAIGRWYLHHHYPVKEGDRQALKFTYPVMMRYREHGEAALSSIGPKDFYYAFFGRRDHYMRSGVVSIALWEKYFGDNYTVYEGTHFMEEEFVESLLVPKILEVLSLQK